jgi:hypothetical protein
VPIREYTTREYAAKEGVSIRDVRLWISKGAVEARKTAGGTRWRIIERDPDGNDGPKPTANAGR